MLLHFAERGASTSLAAAVVGALAATVALGLDDPAHALLAPVPVGARHRIGVRVALVVPVAVLGVVGFDAVTGAHSAATGIAQLLALAATAVAVAVVAGSFRPDAAPTLGAAVALGWSLSAALVPEGVLGDLASLWYRHPWLVVAVAALGFALAPAGNRPQVCLGDRPHQGVDDRPKQTRPARNLVTHTPSTAIRPSPRSAGPRTSASTSTRSRTSRAARARNAPCGGTRRRSTAG